MAAYGKPAASLQEDRYIWDYTQITLRDGTKATLVPINDVSHAPDGLIDVVHQLLNSEIEAGDTYPQDTILTKEAFTNYYFSYFTAVLILGEYKVEQQQNVLPKDIFGPDFDFKSNFLGSYYIKPNYPGRASHNCNGGFLVSAAARGKGIGVELGKCYLTQAPRLGFRASIFNLVFVTNVASYKIWDKLGFKRIGLVPKAADLKGKGYTDAYVYYYDFCPEETVQ